MAITALGARRRLQRDGLGHLLPETRFEQLLEGQGYHWRKRLLTPAVVLRLFILQILNGNLAINALRHLSGINFSAGAYCLARMRLPLSAFSQLLRDIVEDFVRTGGPRIFVVDGSSVSMSDTPKLRQRFGLPSNQKPGIGYPQASILGLLDLASGLIVRLVVRSVFTHNLRGALRVHDALQAGDILLGDRAFCAMTHLALLAERGVFCCFRLHQARRVPRAGQTRWRKKRQAPRWIKPELHAKLRTFVKVRIIRKRITLPGMRSRRIVLATTLLDHHQWPDQKIVDLYRRRWEIETSFGHLKTTLNMAILKCRSGEGVMKELAVYLIVYNLIRLQMLQWASRQHLDVRRVSFIDAARQLAARTAGLRAVDRLILNPDRTGRTQLRTIRRRPKHYPWLTKTRSELENEGLN